jgi:quercetin 2,3-dioxygenase
MQMQIRRSLDRGHADHGWLDTRHTFSFAGYHDPRFMGFSHLRVLNEDRVAPGAGFPTHPHANMEILSYVVEGGLAHRDTLGTGSVVRPGEVQVMSAGRGVAHSEFNASDTDPLHFLQVWFLPRQAGGAPRYDQKAFDTDVRGATLLVSPEGRDGSLTLGQDVDVWRILLDPAQTLEHPVRRDRAWAQVVKGAVDVSGARLQAGDGLAVVDADTLHLTAHDAPVEALLFDLI